MVKTAGVNASAGAGAVIEMPEEMEPNLKHIYYNHLDRIAILWIQ